MNGWLLFITPLAVNWELEKYSKNTWDHQGALKWGGPLPLSQKETRICGLGKVRGLKRGRVRLAQSWKCFYELGTFDARVSASQHPSLEEFPGFHENRMRCRKAIGLNFHTTCLSTHCNGFVRFRNFWKCKNCQNRTGVGQPVTLSKILSMQKSPKPMRHQKLPKKSNYRVSFARRNGSSQFDPLNLLRRN
jgi:hypothetical protein